MSRCIARALFLATLLGTASPVASSLRAEEAAVAATPWFVGEWILVGEYDEDNEMPLIWFAMQEEVPSASALREAGLPASKVAFVAYLHERLRTGDPAEARKLRELYTKVQAQRVSITPESITAPGEDRPVFATWTDPTRVRDEVRVRVTYLDGDEGWLAFRSLGRDAVALRQKGNGGWMWLVRAPAEDSSLTRR